MTTKPWSITYKDEIWSTHCSGVSSDGKGFYQISFEGSHYGFISQAAWDRIKTGDILKFVEQMLNDAHDLALRQKDE